MVGQTAEADAVTQDDSQTANVAPGVSPTLCDLFARTLARTPDALALSDPHNKPRITGQPAARLTYAQADRAIAALAAQLTGAGLPVGSVIALQLPNTVEFVLTALAAWRSGLVVALLPQLWRQAELSEALNRVGARAIVSSSRIEIIDHADLSMNAAAEAFSIRHVFGFGDNLPDGMIPLDWTMQGDIPPLGQGGSVDARRAAVVSFDMTPDGLLAVPRSHVNLIAGGLAITIDANVAQGARLMSSILPSSFGGLVSSVVTWLLGGGALSLHHPFDPQLLEDQMRDEDCDTLIAPGPLALRLAEAGTLDALPGLRQVLGLWRTPERIASSNDWPSRQTTLADIYLFGEIGLVAAPRPDDGAPAEIFTAGASLDPGAKAGRTSELVLTPHGTVGMRGAMVAMAAYRPPPKGSSALLASVPVDYADTGYAAKRNKTTGAISITAPPSGIVGVGGYRFREQDLDRWASRLASGAMLTALPDQLNGFRLAGRTSDNARAREALMELGLNPLMTEAFRERGGAR